MSTGVKETVIQFGEGGFLARWSLWDDSHGEGILWIDSE